MRKPIGLIIFLLVLLVFAAITNPSKDAFVEWASQEVKQDSESELEKILDGVFAKPVFELSTNRKDYVFFSLFTLDNNDEVKYLGLFKQFIKISWDINK